MLHAATLVQSEVIRIATTGGSTFRLKCQIKRDRVSYYFIKKIFSRVIQEILLRQMLKPTTEDC